MDNTADQPRLLRVLRAVADALESVRVPWALIGGLAVSVRVEPRFTRDIDLAVAVDDDAGAERLVQELMSRGFGLLMSLEHDALARLAAVRLMPPGETEAGVVVDLLFASSGIEPEICRDAERLEIAPHLFAPVARAGHLVALKVLAEHSDRPQDAADLRALTRTLGSDERQRALGALQRVTALGANRGKALEVELGRWMVP